MLFSCERFDETDERDQLWCFLIYNIEIKCCCRYFQGGIVHYRVEGKEVNDNAIIDDSNFIHSHFMIIFD